MASPPPPFTPPASKRFLRVWTPLISKDRGWGVGRGSKLLSRIPFFLMFYLSIVISIKIVISLLIYALDIFLKSNASEKNEFQHDSDALPRSFTVSTPGARVCRTPAERVGVSVVAVGGPCRGSDGSRVSDSLEPRFSLEIHNFTSGQNIFTKGGRH